MNDYTTLIPTTMNIIETTTAILTSTTTETTTSITPITTLALIDNEKIQDVTTTKTIITMATTTTLNSSFETNYKSITKSPIQKSTHYKLQSYVERHASTEQVKINYTDPSKLDLCDGYYDAITMYKGILFIFKGQVNFNLYS